MITLEASALETGYGQQFISSTQLIKPHRLLKEAFTVIVETPKLLWFSFCVNFLVFVSGLFVE